MKRFASHYLFMPDVGFIKQQVVEITDEGVVRDTFPLTEEIESVEWMPGVIVLLPADQLEEIKNGNFTDDDINFAEMAIKNDFKSVADSAGNVSSWYFDCIRKNDIVTPEEKLERYIGVSKERIIAAAKSMMLDSVYVLTGNEE